MMSETTMIDGRDSKTGQFVAGFRGGPGRKPGSRNKITEEFLRMFAADVSEHGASVIERVRTEKPEVYLRVWADLLPAKSELSVNVDMHDITSTLEAFRTMAALVGSDPTSGLRRLRQLAPDIIDVDAS
jgi:hypothetical protein